MLVKNPILKGFNPDPSLLCVGNDYYIANSTFEYFPGVQIHHSNDLVNWTLISRPLNTVKLLDMKGNPPSGGIWAPQLSYDKGVFYLIYTDVKNQRGPFKDSHNYLTMATDIKGPWCDPIYLNSSGFDPSLFHDDDNKKYLVNMEWDHRKVRGYAQFTGILLQEYSVKEKKLIGPIEKIFTGSDIGVTEGPHLFKKAGYYYLITAEGGTSYEHAVTIARSKTLNGPYEIHPKNPLITSYQTDCYLQKAGHGNLIQSASGEWYLSHLCSRPLPDNKRCILGRETALQNITWKEDWPYLSHGGQNPSDYFEVEGQIEEKIENEMIYHFNNQDFLTDFQTLRIPYHEDMFNLYERPGYLRLYGQESISSRHKQTVLVRRQEDFCFEVETGLEFNPTHFQQLAGLIYRYNEETQYYLFMSFNEDINENELRILSFDRGTFCYLTNDKIVSFTQNEIYLKLKVEYNTGQFYYSLDGKTFYEIGTVIDASILSDDYAKGFTGAFVGMAAVDLQNHESYADFRYFKYSRI